MPCKFPIKWYRLKEPLRTGEIEIRVVAVVPENVTNVLLVQPYLNVAEPGWGRSIELPEHKSVRDLFDIVSYEEVSNALGYKPDVALIIRRANGGA